MLLFLFNGVLVMSPDISISPNRYLQSMLNSVSGDILPDILINWCSIRIKFTETNINLRGSFIQVGARDGVRSISDRSNCWPKYRDSMYTYCFRLHPHLRNGSNRFLDASITCDVFTVHSDKRWMGYWKILPSLVDSKIRFVKSFLAI